MSQPQNLFPLPHDTTLGENKLADFIKNCRAQQITDIESLINRNQYRALLQAIFADSPYISGLLMRNIAFAVKLFVDTPDRIFNDIIIDLHATLPYMQETARVKQKLRQAKAEVALLVSFADLSGYWPLATITRNLTQFADTAVSLAVSHLLRAEMVRGNLAVPPHSAQRAPDELVATADLPCDTGYVVMAMGKMGAHELNYSSDIDLIVLFDNDIVNYTGRRSAQDMFIKLTQNLCQIMQERTADGYVFRTDLRLRPDPGATAVALSMEGAEIYYQSMGLNWERAAMIKARPVAGDIQAGHDFMNRIKSFVWRKHLDFVALEDIYAIKKLIHRHHRHKEMRFAGHDVKLGHGGIREIEFYAQIFQLLLGGREPELRVPATCEALDALERNQQLSPEDNQKLQQAYVYYRTLEHRLQMINDDQTHSLPDSRADLDRITAFMGYRDQATFEAELMGHLKNVHDLFTDLLKEAHQEDEDEGEILAFPAEGYDKATLATIAAAGFQNPEAVYDMVKVWLLGRFRACRTARARKLLQGLIPDILNNFGKLANPDSSLLKFNAFLSGLPSGVQFFSFIKAQPWLLQLLAEIIDMAPALSDQLAKRPLLLDAVLNHGFFDVNFTVEDLRQHLEGQLTAAKDFQDILDVTRKWAGEYKFQVSIQILRNNMNACMAGKNLSMVADVTLDVMLEKVKQEFARKHGRVPGAEFAVLALGKLGGEELTTTSDLDLVFIYHVPEDQRTSDGDKPLSINHYFARLSQQYINALTAMTGEGRLYEIDMRLRPSGNAGPIAVTLESFRRYQKNNAWTWEHLALTRSRVITGPPDLRRQITRTVKDALGNRHRDPDKLLRDTADMRRKLDHQFGARDIWSLKHSRGGLVDIEFLCQYLILRHMAAHPALLTPNSFDQIALLKAEEILPPARADLLRDACEFMQDLQIILRLCMGSGRDFSPQTDGLVDALCDRYQVPSFGALENKLGDIQRKVYEIYAEIIELPAKKIIVSSSEDDSK